MTTVALPPRVLYIGSVELEPITFTVYKASGAVFDGTGWTPSFAMRLEYDPADAFLETGGGKVDWVVAAAGTVTWTPSNGIFTTSACVPGIYPAFILASQAGRTTRFYVDRFELRKAY